MTRKNQTSKASLAGKLSAVTLAIGAMTPMLSACNNGQQGGASKTPSAQQAPKAGPSNPCAPSSQNAGASNPCAPQAASNPCAPQAASNPCAPQAASNPCAPKPAKSDCQQASNPCAPAANCDK
jgi:hypothetical protein